MNKYLKYGLWLIAGIVALVGSVIAYVALTFDPNAYKPQIIQTVKDKTQRTLRLDGNIKLSFFPSIGADIGQVSLSEFQSEKEFAAIESLRVSLAVRPLLSKQVVVDEVAISGLKAHVIKYRDGKTNLDDLSAKGPAPATSAEKSQSASPVKFDIASVKIDKAEFSYSDEASGAQYAVKDLNLTTGRITNGVKGRIDLAAHILANQPKLDVQAKLRTALTFDLDKRFFQLGELNLQASGSAVANKFEARLDIPQLSLNQERITGQGIALNANLDAAFGKVAVVLAMPELTGDAEKFRLNGLALNVDVQQPEQSFKLKLSTPLTGNLKTRQFNLSDLVIALNASGDKLPGKSISSELKGSVQADIGRQSIQANLAGGLLQSQVKAKAAVNNFAAPAIRYDLELDQFDADLFIPKAPADATAKEKAVPVPEQPFDLSALKPLNIEGSVRIGALKAANVKVSQLRVDVKAKGGVVKVAPFTANLYQGSLASDIALNASNAQPQFSVNAKLSGVEIGPLLNDAAHMDFLNGKGNVALNVSTQGNLVSLLKRNLNGNLSVVLADGAVKGINLAKSVREFGKGGGDKAQAANKEEKTDFSEMKASFKISNGVAHNEDLALKSPFIRVGGKGDINLGADSLDYLVKATLAGTLEGQGGKDSVGGVTVPVRLSGPFTALQWKLEFGSMVSDAAKQKAAAVKQQAQAAAQKAKDEAKAKAQEQLKQGLKGLFR